MNNNRDIAKVEVAASDELFPVPAGFKEYIDGRIEIFGKAGIRAYTNGFAVKEDYDNATDEVKVNVTEAVAALIDANSEMLGTVDVLEAEKEKYLNEDVELPLININVADMPTISTANDIDHREIWRCLEIVAVD